MRLPLSTALEDAQDQLGTDPDVIQRVLARVNNPEYRALIDYYSRTEDDPVRVASRVLRHETRGDLSLPAGATPRPPGLSVATAAGTRRMREVRTAVPVGRLPTLSEGKVTQIEDWMLEHPEVDPVDVAARFQRKWRADLGAVQRVVNPYARTRRYRILRLQAAGAVTPFRAAVRGAVEALPEAGRTLVRTLPFAGALVGERIVGPPPTPEQASMERMAHLFNLPLEIVTAAAAEGATLATIGAQLRHYGMAARRVPQAARVLSEAGRRWRVAGEVVRDSRLGRALVHVGQIFKPRGYLPSAVVARETAEIAPSVVEWTQDTQNLWQRRITARVDPEEHPQLHAFLRDIPQELILLPGGVMGFKANIINAAARGDPEAVAEIAEGFTRPFYSPVESFRENPAGTVVMWALIPGIYTVRALRELRPRERAVAEEVIARGEELAPETPLNQRMRFLQQEFETLMADPERVRALITARPPGAERARLVTEGPRPPEEARALLPREVEPGRARGVAAEREMLIRRPEPPAEVPPEVAPPTPERPAPEAAAEPFGSRNRVVSISDAEAARARLRQERMRGGGPSTEELADYARLGTFYLEGGIREFPEWSTRMVDEFGERVRPHLEDLWKQARAAVPPQAAAEAEARRVPTAEEVFTPAERAEFGRGVGPPAEGRPAAEVLAERRAGVPARERPAEGEAKAPERPPEVEVALGEPRIGYRSRELPGEVHLGGYARGTEGEGLYVSHKPALAEFFAEGRGEQVQEVRYREPSNPLIVREEPLYILHEEAAIMEPIRSGDSTWTRLNKRAVRNTKTTDANWAGKQRELQAELSRLIREEGHDAVRVTSGGETWDVLLDPKLYEPAVTPTRPPEAPTPPAVVAPSRPGAPTPRFKRGRGEPFDVERASQANSATWVDPRGRAVYGGAHEHIGLVNEHFTRRLEMERWGVGQTEIVQSGFLRIGNYRHASGRGELYVEVDSAFVPTHRERILTITDRATEQAPVYLDITTRGVRPRPWKTRITSPEQAEQVLREAEVAADFGSRNTIVTPDRADQARTRLRQPKRHGGGPSTEELEDWTVLGTFYLEGGIRDFPEWSRRMSGELGERVRPHLRAIWRDAQKAAPVPTVDPAVDVIARRIATVEEAEVLAQPKRRLVKGVTQVTRQLGDELVALREAVRDRGVRPSEDPYITLRMETTTAGGRIEQALGTGRTKGWFTDRGERVGESLTEIQDIATSKGRSLDDFRAYLTALDARGELARGRKTPWTPEEVEAGIAALDNPEFRRASVEFQRYNDHLRRLLENEAQVVPPGWSDAMAEKYPNYVPMIRVRGEAPAERLPTAARLGAPQPIRPRRGSELAIVDPLAITARRTAAYHILAERMKARRQLADIADQPDTEWFIRRLPPETIKQADVDKMAMSLAEELQVPASSDAVLETLARMLNDATIWDQMVGASTRGRVLSVWREGKVELHEIHPDLVPIFSRVNTGQAQWWVEPLRMPATVVRATSTTLSPKFWALRNPSRDVLTGYVQSPGYSGYIEGLIKSLYSIVNRTPSEAVFVRAGGKQGAITALTQEPGSLIEAVMQGEHMAGAGTTWAKGAWRRGRRLYEAAAAPGSMIENIPRFGIFLRGMKRHLREGMEYEDALRLAAMEGREGTVPFERKGVTTRAINPYVAFFNARVQGPYTMFQMMRNRPIESFVKGTAAITAPTMIYYLLNRDNPDWQDLPPWRKYSGWNIPIPEATARLLPGPLEKAYISRTGETTFFWMPIPWEWGLVFGMAPMAALEAIRNDDPETWKDLQDVAITQFSPVGEDPTGVLPTLMDPMVHVWANRSWTGRPIVPERLSRVAPELQGSPVTSEIAWQLGRLLKYSPAKIDYLMTGHGGTLSRDVLAVVDQVMEGKGMRPGEARGFMRGILVRASTSSAAMDRFYSELARLRERRSLAEGGRLLMTKQQDMRLQEAEGLSRTLASIRSDKREIMEDAELSAEQKLDEVTKLTALQTYLTTRFMKRPTPTWAARLSENGTLLSTRPTHRPTRPVKR